MTSWKSKIKYSIKTDPKSQNIMKVTETHMQGIKTTISINAEMILTCRLITITYTHNNMYVIQYKLMCIHGC